MYRPAISICHEGSIAGRIAPSVNCATIVLPADERRCARTAHRRTVSTGSSTNNGGAVRT